MWRNKKYNVSLLWQKTPYYYKNRFKDIISIWLKVFQNIILIFIYLMSITAAESYLTGNVNYSDEEEIL